MAHQDEIKKYLRQVKHGRRVATADRSDPRFSQEAEDLRQIRQIERSDAKMGVEDAREQERELGRIESSVLGGKPATKEEREANPQVMELKKRMKDYPLPDNALARFFGMGGGSEDGPRLHGREIRTEWWK